MKYKGVFRTVLLNRANEASVQCCRTAATPALNAFNPVCQTKFNLRAEAQEVTVREMPCTPCTHGLTVSLYCSGFLKMVMGVEKVTGGHWEVLKSSKV